MAKKTLTGQKSQLAVTDGPGEPADNDPNSIAKIILEHRASSVREDVNSHVAYSNGVNALLDDPVGLHKLHDLLVERKVLSNDDVRIALSSDESYRSMLNKITRYREVLIDERVLRYLTPGYSVLYRLLRLYENLNVAEGSDRIERLVAEIEAMPGPLSRQKIENRLKELKAKKQALSNGNLQKPVETAHSPISFANLTTTKQNAAVSQEMNEPVEVSGPTSERVTEAEQERTKPDETAPDSDTIAAALVTPSRSDVTNIIKKYVRGGEPYCLRIGKAMNNDTIIMIVAQMNELTQIAEQLWYWKAKKFDLLILGATPETPDVTRSMAIGVCGKVDPDAVARLQTWATELDLTKLGQQLLKRIPGRRVHLFGPGDAPGWETFADDELWSTEGSNP